MWTSETVTAESCKLNFKKTNDISGFSFWDEDAIVSLLIVKSGWTSPQMYHCILEWGEYTEVDNNLYTSEQIKEKYNIKL
jgi:hypothetical protein